MRLDEELWGENAWARERLAEILALPPADRHFLVAKLAGRVVGYGLLQVENGRSLVEVLGVTATQRRWGLGSALLTELLAEASKRGYTDVYVRARQGDQRPERFYRSFGFEPVGVMADYVGAGINALEMRLDLTAAGATGRLAAAGRALQPRAPRELGYNLAGAITRAQHELGWTLGIIGPPNLVPPPTHDVHFPVQTPQSELTAWRRGIDATRDLAAAAREFLPEPGDPVGDDLRSALEDADRAVLALSRPPASLPATAEQRAALWQDLARFRQAAADLGSVVADILTPAIGEWQRAASTLSAWPEQVRALLPRPGAQQPGLSAALDQLDEAVRAVPSPPKLLPATAAELSDARRAIMTLEPRAQDFRQALDRALNLAVDAWDARVDAARSLVAAVRGLLPHTGSQQPALADRLDYTLAALPDRPSPQDLAEDALQAFGRVVAVEDAARAVLDAVAEEGPRGRVVASVDLERAARDMLPYTGQRQAELTTRLDNAAALLREATPAWWQANGAKLTTMADVQAALRGLEGDEAALVEAAADAFEDVVADVATAANQTGERLIRLRRLAAPHVRGITHRPLMLALNAMPIFSDWPGLRPAPGQPRRRPRRRWRPPRPSGPSSGHRSSGRRTPSGTRSPP